MSPEKLAYMANQIGRAFRSQSPGTAVEAIADHLLKFWDPRMRRALIAGVDDGAATLDPPVAEAVERLRAATSAE